MKVKYSDTLSKMTKNLTIYDQMLADKILEKQALEEEIKQLKLDIKHVKLESKEQKNK